MNKNDLLGPIAAKLESQGLTLADLAEFLFRGVRPPCGVTTNLRSQVENAGSIPVPYVVESDTVARPHPLRGPNH